MNGEHMDLEQSHGLLPGTIPAFRWRYHTKPTRIVNNLAVIQIRYLLNASLQYYYYTKQPEMNNLIL
jgi:hypothetical protein